LHAVTSATCDLRDLAAFRIPRKLADWNSMRLGKTVFQLGLHLPQVDLVEQHMADEGH
jgi:hypothetical protein